MKNGVQRDCLLLLILLIIALPFFSQAEQAVPRLFIEEPEFDFGKVKEGRRIAHAFTLQNKGTAILEIKKVSPG